MDASRPELPEQPGEPGFGGWDEREHPSPDRWRFVRKLQYDPVIPLLDIYLKETKLLIQKNTITPMFK